MPRYIVETASMPRGHQVKTYSTFEAADSANGLVILRVEPGDATRHVCRPQNVPAQPKRTNL